MSKPVVTFSCLPLVAVKIRGESTGRFTLPNDDGLVLRFMRWALEKHITPFQGQFSGGGGYLAYYSSEDAEKIHAWLSKEGAIEDHEKTWSRPKG